MDSWAALIMSIRNTGFETIEEIALMAKAESLKSNDPNTKVGAVLLAQNRLGKYMVSARGHNHIVDKGDPASFDRPLKYDRVIHAEVMAIAEAARMGVGTFRAIVYVTHPPCKECAKLIRAAGVIAVVVGDGEYLSNTPDNVAASKFMLDDAVQTFKVSDMNLLEF